MRTYKMISRSTTTPSSVNPLRRNLLVKKISLRSGSILLFHKEQSDAV